MGDILLIVFLSACVILVGVTGYAKGRADQEKKDRKIFFKRLDDWNGGDW